MNGGETLGVDGNYFNGILSNKVSNYHLARSSDNVEEISTVSAKTTDYNNESVIITHQNEHSLSNFIACTKKVTVLVYGNDIKIKSPFTLGKVYSFWYINSMPLIMIGPDCIYSA